MISDFENTDLETLKDVDMAVNELVKILDFAARKSLQIINIKKKRQHLQKSQPWYDSECKNLKQRLKHISKQKHENPLNKNTRINYHFINKEYKRLLRQKKQIHQNNKMNEIINTTNPNKFWSWLKRMSLTLSTEQSNPQNTSIPIDKLYNHFENLHQKPQITSYLDEQQNIAQNVDEQDLSKLSINELDKPITESEISNAIRLLKTKKLQVLTVYEMKC